MEIHDWWIAAIVAVCLLNSISVGSLKSRVRTLEDEIYSLKALGEMYNGLLRGLYEKSAVPPEKSSETTP